MAKLLDGKRVLVTNAGHYMGPSVVQVFEAEGAEVVANTADLSTPEAVEEAVAYAGVIDVLVANLMEREWWEAFAHQIEDEDWLQYFDYMVHPLMRLTRAVLPQMIERRSGKIVAITSAAPLRGIPKMSGYCAARGAQNAFVRATGIEVARNNVQVNAIAQNYVENPTYYPPELLADAEMMNRMLKVLPAKRLGKGEESAHLAAFLASSHSDFIVGQVIPFAGGWVTTTG